jgi:hypothetical protein
MNRDFDLALDNVRGQHEDYDNRREFEQEQQNAGYSCPTSLNDDEWDDWAYIHTPIEALHDIGGEA